MTRVNVRFIFMSGTLKTITQKIIVAVENPPKVAEITRKTHIEFVTRVLTEIISGEHCKTIDRYTDISVDQYTLACTPLAIRRITRMLEVLGY
jgi:hypothetical protein